jgi:addiction module HigA family antidote
MTERDDPRLANFCEPLFTFGDVTEEEILRVYADKFLATGKKPPEMPHPGLVLRALLENDEIDRELFARWLEFRRHIVLGVLSGRVPVSSRLANRLAEKLGPEPSFWLEMQRRFDQNHSQREAKDLERDELGSDLTEPSDKG